MWAQTLILINIILTAHSRPLVESLSPNFSPDLAGLLGSDVFFSSQYGATTVETVFSSETASRAFGSTVTSEKKSSKTMPTTAGTTHSIIGTLPTAVARTTATLSSMSASSSAAIPSVGTTTEAARMSPGEAAEWKVIGLVVICIGFVATSILSIVFFDSWWGFLRDLVCGKRRREGIEDMVPDWEKRSWEFKLASEDGHRYPTLASLECIVKDRAGDHDGSAVHPIDSDPRLYPELMTPRLPYLSDRDPHPLEPFFRRPSTRQITPPKTRS